mmetsp:Transcript_24367/g.67755  ORF Transcript_24367/g.67755 Transcript_24367/m.67755 type:complete len:333 (+) Transcript_24367:165-1163(+)
MRAYALCMRRQAATLQMHGPGGIDQISHEVRAELLVRYLAISRRVKLAHHLVQRCPIWHQLLGIAVCGAVHLGSQPHFQLFAAQISRMVMVEDHEDHLQLLDHLLPPHIQAARKELGIIDFPVAVAIQGVEDDIRLAPADTDVSKDLCHLLPAQHTRAIGVIARKRRVDVVKACGAELGRHARHDTMVQMRPTAHLADHGRDLTGQGAKGAGIFDDALALLQRSEPSVALSRRVAGVDPQCLAFLKEATAELAPGLVFDNAEIRLRVVRSNQPVQGEGRLGREGKPPAAQHLVKDHPDAPQVSLLVKIILPDLGRNVMRRPPEIMESLALRV